MKIGFLQLLTVVFITLKLTGFIAWPWWLVLMPLFLSIALLFLIFLFLILREVTK